MANGGDLSAGLGAGDDDGEVVERVEYDAYGRARLFGKDTDGDGCNLPLPRSAVGLEFLFTGQRWQSRRDSAIIPLSRQVPGPGKEYPG